MGITNSKRIAVIAALVGISLAAAGQTQNAQSQNAQTQNQTQAQPNQNSQTQAQPAQGQPQQKQSFWQKMKQSAMQNMQNTTQQGTQQVQQGVQGATNGVQQGAQGLQQGAQQAVGAGGTQGSSAFTGGGSSGSCGATCYNAGPFVANVSQMTMSQPGGGWHLIRMEMQFQNTTNQPLVIAYHDGSMVMTDNNGNTYQGCGGNPGELQGMGIDRGASTDPQFTLNPGQTSSAMFCVARLRAANSPVGTNYSYNLTIDQLQTQNGASAIVTRSYNMNLPSLTPGSTSSLTSFQSGSPANSFTGGSTGSAPASTTGAVLATQKPATAAPAPSTGVTNASMKSAVVTTAKPSPAVKPIPAATTTNVKKTTTTNTNPPSTTTPH